MAQTICAAASAPLSKQPTVLAIFSFSVGPIATASDSGGGVPCACAYLHSLGVRAGGQSSAVTSKT